MKRTARVLLALAGCSGGADGDRDGAVLDGVVLDAPGPDGPVVDPLIGVGTVEPLFAALEFAEGPQWRDATGDLLFSDIPASTIFRYDPSDGRSTFRSPSGNSNGLALDPSGVLIACEHGNRRVSRGDTNPTTVVDRFEGARLNSPNDAIMRADGNLYFTDPPFGIQDAQRELSFMGTFRVAPGGAITAIRRGALTERPNGIALSPDGSVLYVGDAANALIRAYDLDAAGEASNERTFAQTADVPDGIAVDLAGNLFVATDDGIEVFAADATRWGVITLPDQPSNVAFGEVDHRTLFITARTRLYEVRLANPGIP